MEAEYPFKKKIMKKKITKYIRFNKPSQGLGGIDGLQSFGGTLDYSIPTCPVIEWPESNMEDKGV